MPAPTSPGKQWGEIKTQPDGTVWLWDGKVWDELISGTGAAPSQTGAAGAAGGVPSGDIPPKPTNYPEGWEPALRSRYDPILDADKNPTGQYRQTFFWEPVKSTTKEDTGAPPYTAPKGYHWEGDTGDWALVQDAQVKEPQAIDAFPSYEAAQAEANRRSETTGKAWQVQPRTKASDPYIIAPVEETVDEPKRFTSARSAQVAAEAAGPGYVAVEVAPGQWELDYREPESGVTEPPEVITGDNGNLGYWDTKGIWHELPKDTMKERLDQLIWDSIVAGDTESLKRAQAYFDFQNQPTSMELAQFAMDASNSVADYMTIWAIARGEMPVQAQGPFDRIAPYSQFFQDALNRVFQWSSGAGLDFNTITGAATGDPQAIQQVKQLGPPGGPQFTIRPGQFSTDYMPPTEASIQNPPRPGEGIANPFAADQGYRSPWEEEQAAREGTLTERNPYATYTPPFEAPVTAPATFPTGSLPADEEAWQYEQAAKAEAQRTGAEAPPFNPSAPSAPPWAETEWAPPPPGPGQLFPTAPNTQNLQPSPVPSTGKGAQFTSSGVDAWLKRTGQFTLDDEIARLYADIPSGPEGETPEWQQKRREAWVRENAMRSQAQGTTRSQTQGTTSQTTARGALFPSTETPTFLKRAYAGQIVQPVSRQYPAMGGPPFPSPESVSNMLPSEREGFQASVKSQGIPWGDYEEQMRRTTQPTSRRYRRGLFNAGYAR